MSDSPYPVITAEMFKDATGHEPIEDDLERSNCPMRGVLHSQCGWCTHCNAPFFHCGGSQIVHAIKDKK